MKYSERGPATSLSNDLRRKQPSAFRRRVPAILATSHSSLATAFFSNQALTPTQQEVNGTPQQSRVALLESRCNEPRKISYNRNLCASPSARQEWRQKSCTQSNPFNGHLPA